jgi:hypothetical protein
MYRGLPNTYSEVNPVVEIRVRRRKEYKHKLPPIRKKHVPTPIMV